MADWLRERSNDTFIRRVAVLSSGIGVSQLIVIAAAPILTRLYEPNEIGVLSAFNAALGIALIASCWRYERAIPLSSSKRVGIVIIWLSMIVLILNMSFLSLALLCLKNSIAKWLDMPASSQYLWFLPFGLLFAGIYELLTFTAVRDLNYRLLAKTKVYQGVGQISTQIVLGITNIGAAGLIIGNILGRSLGSHSLYRAMKAHWKFRPRRYYFAHLWIVARRYWQFPAFSAPAGALNRTAAMAPPLLFIAFYDTQVAGFLYLTQHVILGPLAFIGRSVAKVFLGHASNGHRAGTLNIGKLVDTTLIRLLLIGALPIGFVALLGPVIFGWIFGAKWIEAGHYARYLAIALWFQFAMGPLLQTLIVLEKQGRQVMFDSVRLTLVIGIIVIMHGIQAEARQTVIGYSCALGFSYVIGYVLVRVTAYNAQLNVKKKNRV
jgi:O-antigen/teichoic acid export membrane protein